MDLGTVVSREGNTILTSKKKRITLDEETFGLPYDDGDSVFYISSKDRILFLVPSTDDEVEKEILSSPYWNCISLVFRKIIISKIREYLASNTDNEFISMNKGREISMFMNIVSWKSFYYDLGEGILKKTVNNCVSGPIIKLFVHKWLERHLFRQFSLWKLTVPEVRDAIEQVSIGDKKKYTIEDFMIILSETPGRFWNLSKEKITSLEGLFGSNPVPFKFSRCGSKLKKSLPYETYIDIDQDLDENEASKYGILLFDEGKKASFSHIREMERRVSDQLSRKIRRCEYKWKEKKAPLNYVDSTLSEDQKEAVKMVFLNPISVITGGPGTGKTRVIKSIIEECLSRKIAYHVTAFTGKAVTRVRETTAPLSISSSTIDLMITKGEEFYDFSLLIVEEASMITTKHLYRLFKEFPPIKYSIVFVGDLNQIPPIEWGHIFHSLLWSKRVPYKRLIFNYRVDAKLGKEITINAERIVDPLRSLVLPPEFDLSADSFNIIKGNRDLVISILKKIGAIGKDITILSPYNVEVDVFNKVFQSILFSKESSFKQDIWGKKWYIGDKVMLLKNINPMDVMNGDVGEVIELSPLGVKVSFSQSSPPKELTFSLSSNNDSDYPTKTYLDHAYALTINKSQGSEYETVILYIPHRNSNDFFLNRNLIYTAITRAKKMVWIISENIDDFIKGCNRKIHPSKDSIIYDIQMLFPDVSCIDNEDVSIFEEVEESYDDYDMYGDD